MASSSGRQANFAALNRGHHLCSAGRPSGWALAHILVLLMSVWLALPSQTQLDLKVITVNESPEISLETSATDTSKVAVKI